MLGPIRGGFGGGPTSIGERNECQRGRWALKGVDYNVPHGWGGEQTLFIRVWKPSPSRRVLKPSGKAQRGRESGPLQMISELDTRRCVSLLAVPWRGVDTRRCASKDAEPRRGVNLVAVPHRLEKGTSADENVGPWRGWIVMSHIGWGGEQNTIDKGVETFPYHVL